MLQKDVYPYEYLDDFENLIKHHSKKEAFYSNLKHGRYF